MCEQIDKSLSTQEYINAHGINKYNGVNKLLSKFSAKSNNLNITTVNTIEKLKYYVRTSDFLKYDHFTYCTEKQLDISNMNKKNTIVVFSFSVNSKKLCAGR